MEMLEYLYRKVKQIMDTWDAKDIYAVSFLVQANQAFSYNGCSNVSQFSICYNTESGCNYEDELSEERWNYACWTSDVEYIIDTYHKNEATDRLFEWYGDNGITKLGYEDKDCYDVFGKYIGKGPNGHYELVNLVAEVARKLQEEQYLNNRFGKEIPILIHGLEYTWYDIEATKRANPHGAADTFLKALKSLGWIE